jgi:glycosyltransferase involved in cell wall biosynthesis
MVPDNGEGKIRILRVIGRLNVGGPSIHVVNLSTGLDPIRFDQLLVVGKESRDEGSMLNYALARGVWPHRISEMVTSFNLTPRDIKALHHLWKLMRLYRPQIVHTHTAKAGLLGRLAARLAGVPIVIHTFHGHVLHGYYGPLQNWALQRMERTLACLSDRLVAVSERVKQDLIGYGVASAQKITVIPLGLDLAPFSTARRRRGGFRREMGISADTKLIGIVGRIVPIKNHALFIEAAARIAALERAARFVVVGDGALRRTIENQARRLDIAERILFTGWRSDLAQIYADLDALVVTSKNEGTPLSAIEAMATGCPVVATCVGGIPDIITDKITGRLSAPGDADGISRAVIELLTDSVEAARIGANAMTAAHQRFAVERLISDMDKLYSKLLDEKAIHYRVIERIEAEVTNETIQL